MSEGSPSKEDLSPTARYTAEVWSRHGFPGSDWFSHRETRITYWVVRLILGFYRLFRWGLPQLEEGLHQRHLTIDRLVDRTETQRLVEVAAGFSARFVRYLTSKPDACVVELDRPIVRKEKSRLLQQSAGASWLEDARYTMHEGDALCLTQHIHPAPDKPTCIVAEGLLMYFSPEDRQRFFEEAFSVLVHGRGGTLIFDLTPPAEEPPPGFVGRILAFLMKAVTGGGAFHREPTTEADIIHSLQRAGFTHIHVTNPAPFTELYPGVLTLQRVFQASVKEKTSSGVDYLA